MKRNVSLRSSLAEESVKEDWKERERKKEERKEESNLTGDVRDICTDLKQTVALLSA